MGLRFQHRVTLFPGVRINFSGGGISTTLGVPLCQCKRGTQRKLRRAVLLNYSPAQLPPIQQARRHIHGAMCCGAIHNQRRSRHLSGLFFYE